MENIILYHDNCPDGFTAAWAAWRAFGDHAEYYPVNYGQVPPFEHLMDKRVFLVDFSYPREQLNKIAALAASVVIYDHHKTAEEALRNWDAEAPETRHVVFDQSRSGAGITWDELYKQALIPGLVRPKIISYVEDRDLWVWKLNGSRAVSEYLFAVPRNFHDWDRFALALEEDVDGVVKIGEMFLLLKRERVSKICENARFMSFDGVHIPVVNTAWDMSEIGEFLCQKYPDALAGGYYFDRIDKRQWGFRARGDFDVSALCKKYGGGGHKSAAGFTSEIGWLPA